MEKKDKIYKAGNIAILALLITMAIAALVTEGIQASIYAGAYCIMVALYIIHLSICNK